MATPDMQMDGLATDGMAMHCTSMNTMATDETMKDNTAAVAMSTPFSAPIVPDEAVADKFDQPAESCPHCLSHSALADAPVSFLSIPAQSGKDVASVPLPVARFLIRPAMTLSPGGLPKQHAPPDSRTPRHILISVFLI